MRLRAKAPHRLVRPLNRAGRRALDRRSGGRRASTRPGAGAGSCLSSCWQPSYGQATTSGGSGDSRGDAGKVNRAQPGYCVDRIARALNEAERSVKGAKILILGVSYKPGVGDIRESPALEIVTLLRELGAEVSYHDPFVPELGEFGVSSVELEAGLAGADIAAIVTAHPDIDYGAVVAAAPLTIDFRGVTREIDSSSLVRL